MPNTRWPLLAALALFALPSIGVAAEVKPFTAAALKAAQDAGKPVVVDVTAPWCPTCKAQKPILSELVADPKYKDMVVLDVDFDSQKAALRQLNVRAQSTLVAYKGKAEVGRSTGDTDKASIGQLFDKAS